MKGAAFLVAKSLVLESVAAFVFGLADFLLHLAGGFVHLAFGLHLGVTGQPANSILHGAFNLFASAFDLVLMHNILLWI